MTRTRTALVTVAVLLAVHVWDVASTWAAFQQPGIEEGRTISAWLFDQFGFPLWGPVVQVPLLLSPVAFYLAADRTPAPRLVRVASLTVAGLFAVWKAHAVGNNTALALGVLP